MKKLFLLTIILFLGMNKTNSQNFEYKESGTDFILMDLSIPLNNPNIAFAGGSQFTTEHSPGIVIKSEDAGETWEDINIGSEIYGVKIIQFFDENQGIILYMNDEYDMEVRMTQDGGETWQLSTTPPMHGIQKISYADENTLYAVGFNASVYKSVDAGDNWEIIHQQPMVINMSVAFKDADHGIYSGEEGDLYVTKDGGETWSNPLYTGYHFFTGLAYKGNHIIAAGTDEYVYVSTDEGETFEMTFNGPGDASMYEIQFFEDNSGLISGSGGTMIKFTDLMMATQEVSQVKSAVYPNPTKSKLNIKNTNGIDWIEVIDLTGKSILKQTFHTTDAQIDLSGYANGVYIIRVGSKGRITSHKVSKN